jgi:ligand-binding sensor domain-containing protein
MKIGPRVWLGTAAVSIFDREARTFTHFTEKDGLPNGVICGILEDERRAWVSTNKGLSRFNPITRSFKNFDLADGLQEHVHHRRLTKKER